MMSLLDALDIVTQVAKDQIDSKGADVEKDKVTALNVVEDWIVNNWEELE